MSDWIKNIEFSWSDEDSNEFYHSQNEYCSASTLKKIKQSPAHWRYEERTETDAFRIGSAYHSYVLEPEKFEEEFFVFDDSVIVDVLLGEGAKRPTSTSKYKEWKENELLKAKGKTLLSIQEFLSIKDMKQRLFGHFYTRNLLTNGVAERSHYATIETTTGETFKIRIRPDFMNVKKRICIDLKSCIDCSTDKFAHDSANLGYHIQAALYADILEHIYSPGLPWTFIFVAQEKKKPFAFQSFECSHQFITQGRYEYEMLLLLWDECIKKEKFPDQKVFAGNKYGIQELNLPGYAMKEIDFTIY